MHAYFVTPELESALQIGDTFNYDDDDGWKTDWVGNLQLYDKEVIVNKGYLIDNPSVKPVRITFCDWVASNASGSTCLRGLELLFRFVYNMKGTPAMAKKILAYALQRPADSSEQRLEYIVNAILRVSFDPAVLQQDGWTITKVDTPEEGEAFYIGRKIIWQKYEAIVIAFTPDETYGGLWKGMFLEDFETFDLESVELQSALRKWEMKQKQSGKKKTTRSPPPSGSTRFAATANFTVDGIENGIILAVPTSKAAQGVPWPARVRHFIEGSVGGSRRTSSKNQVEVVFLAPFWNGLTPPLKASDSTDPYSLGPIVEFDSIEVSEYNILKYPFDTIVIEKVWGSFRFLGLPKTVFARYLDAHRLAVALKVYAINHISDEHTSRSDDQVMASANLTESHALSLRTPIFPHVALTIPFEYILSKLPHPSELPSTLFADDEDNKREPTIDIDAIIRSMSPPDCFGERRQNESNEQTDVTKTPEYRRSVIMSPDKNFTPASDASSRQEEEDSNWSLKKFASDFLYQLLQLSSGDDGAIDGLAHMEKLLTSLIANLKRHSGEMKGYSASKKQSTLRNLLRQCLVIKGHGEDSLECCTITPGVSRKVIIVEWRKACERVYKRALRKFSSQGIGNSVTSVVTDSRCHEHLTLSGSVERPVRIPVAIKGARRAGAGTDPNVLLLTHVEDSYLITAEDVVLPKAHKMSYIKRLKTKISSIAPDQIGVPLTDDSDGEGGEDTLGSRGSYSAAIVGVAASIKAADMVVGGQCINAFCAVRPPGHHAGQELRSMSTISNGFCLFNAAACASLYATTPVSQGGLGLRRVCVIDFDVHHGNGTQDILCSTFDPRFLYVSLHAGGAHINGYDGEDSDDELFRLKLGRKKQDGIFPGRCGDTSPHEGVLNIPLGKKVTASAMGAALVSQVSPRVESFSPDLIILSAGFDAHVNDPLDLGGLTAEDFRSVTEVVCQMAARSCSGRVFSVLEGGYGVPCCQPRDDLFLPSDTTSGERLLQLGIDLPADMKDEVPFILRRKLDRCHEEGFMHCVEEHVRGFINSNKC
jgi:acetoin utilization deacetylase AcuC-like enzyme